MFNIILYQPEIPPNTGNVIRMSANAGARPDSVRNLPVLPGNHGPLGGKS